jgi:hypothetical protein
VPRRGKEAQPQCSKPLPATAPPPPVQTATPSSSNSDGLDSVSQSVSNTWQATDRTLTASIGVHASVTASATPSLTGFPDEGMAAIPRFALPDGAPRTAVEATGVATAAVSIIAGPGAAVAANRALVAVHVLACATHDVEDPEFTEYPIGVGLGSGDLAMHRGAVVLNLVLVAGLCGLWQGLCHFGAALSGRVGFLFATAWCVLTPSTSRSAVLLLQEEGDVLWRAVAGVGYAAVLLGQAGLMAALARSRPRSEALPLPTTRVAALCQPQIQWISSSDAVADVKNNSSDDLSDQGPTPTVPFRYSWGRLLDDVRGDYRYVGVEWGVSVVVGSLGAGRPTTVAGCRALGVALLVVHAAYCAALCVLRYHSSVVSRAGAIAVAALGTVVFGVVCDTLFRGYSANSATAIAYGLVLTECVAMLVQLCVVGAWLHHRVGKGCTAQEGEQSSTTLSSSDAASDRSEDASGDATTLDAPLLLVASEVADEAPEHDEL